MVNTPKKIDHPEPNLYKEPRNQKFLAPLFFSCESSGESVSLSFCLALAAFSEPPPLTSHEGCPFFFHVFGMLPQRLLQVWGEASYALLVVAVGVLPTTSPGTVEAARAKQKDRLTASPLLSQLNEICGKAIPEGGFNT